MKEHLEIALNTNIVHRSHHRAVEAKFISGYLTSDGKPLIDIEYQLYDSSIPSLNVMFYHYDKTKQCLYHIPFLVSTVAYNEQLIAALFKRMIRDLFDFYKEMNLESSREVTDTEQ